MKKLNLQLFVLIMVSTMFIATGCKDDPPVSDPEPAISEDFTLNNTKWFFQTVEATGTVLGNPQEDKDNMPGGFVEFNEDGTGLFDFQIELLDMDYGKVDPITWERVSNTEVRIVESDGDVNDWTLIRANDVLVEASWTLRIATDEALFTALLTAEE